MPTIENTTITPRYVNGELRSYKIEVNEGYVIHTSNYDFPEVDEYDNETGNTMLGFTGGTLLLGYNYDFENVVPDTYSYVDGNGMTVSVPINKVGRFEIFTLPIDIVPENQIFGVDEPEHEVM